MTFSWNTVVSRRFAGHAGSLWFSGRIVLPMLEVCDGSSSWGRDWSFLVLQISPESSFRSIWSHVKSTLVFSPTSHATYKLDDKKHLCLGFKLMVLRGPVEPYLLPAGRVAEVALAEDDPVEGGGELQVDRHPALLAGDVQPGDLGKVYVGNIARFEESHFCQVRTSQIIN